MKQSEKMKLSNYIKHGGGVGWGVDHRLLQVSCYPNLFLTTVTELKGKETKTFCVHQLASVSMVQEDREYFKNMQL